MTLARAVFMILTFTSATFAQALTTEQILAKLDENAKVFQTFEASVTMVQVIEQTKTPAESGKIYMKGGKTPPMVLADFTAPARAAKTVLVKDGKALLYNRSQNNYQEFRAEPNSNAFQLLLTGLGVSAETIKKNYIPQAKGRETIDGVTTEVLDLPFQQPGQFKKITLWLDPKTWTPAQIRITTKGDDTTDYKYSNVRLNKGISDSVFKLNIPKNATKR